MNFNFKEEIILSNEFVLLQPIVLSDMENLFRIAISDPTLLQFSPKPIHSRQLLNAYIYNAISECQNETRYSFSIFSKKDACYAGSTAFLNISNTNASIEIGATWLDHKFHGTGLNRQCKYLLLSYAFDTIGAHRVVFRTDERNIGSRKAIEKIGGKFEGLHREDMLMYDGYRRNTLYYSILKNEWLTTKDNFI